jgi:hypothetical protein
MEDTPMARVAPVIVATMTMTTESSRSVKAERRGSLVRTVVIRPLLVLAVRPAGSPGRRFTGLERVEAMAEEACVMTPCGPRSSRASFPRDDLSQLSQRNHLFASSIRTVTTLAYPKFQSLIIEYWHQYFVKMCIFINLTRSGM